MVLCLVLYKVKQVVDDNLNVWMVQTNPRNKCVSCNSRCLCHPVHLKKSQLKMSERSKQSGNLKTIALCSVINTIILIFIIIMHLLSTPIWLRENQPMALSNCELKTCSGSLQSNCLRSGLDPYTLNYKPSGLTNRLPCLTKAVISYCLTVIDH